MFKKLLFVFCVLFVGANAAYLEEKKWERGESFLTFLENNKLPLSLYYQGLDRQDRELAAEIRSDCTYQVLKNDLNEIEQVLIPVSDELQLHIIKDKSKEQFSISIAPISYQKHSLKVVVEVQNSPYQDIVNATKSYSLANEFLNSYKKSVNFRNVKRGDRIVIFYSQRKRLGKPYANPTIEAAMVEVNRKKHYVFLYDNNSYFDQRGRELEGYLLKRPLNRYKRISSKFTYKRWHPILKRYRAHLGIDYAARTGTPILSAGNGTVIFVGNKGGYGKTIIIRHKEGYKTLYAHLHRYKVRRGMRVSKGQHIGYVGNTGMSTGPHLHFGLYKNSRAINPNNIIRVTKNKISKKSLKAFKVLVEDYKKKFEVALNERPSPTIEEKMEHVVLFHYDKAKLSTN